MYDVKTLDGRFLMSPRNDFTFKVLFGSENNKHLLSSLVSSIIREPVNEITLCNPYLIRKYQYEKEGVLDIKLKNKTGLQVFIEMQAYDYKSMNKRMLFYWAKMYSDQLPKGKDYSELNRTIGINVLGYPGLLCDQPFSCYQVLEKRVHEVYCETFEIHVLKLAKNDIHKRCKNNKELLAWFTFLGATTEEEMIMAAEAIEAVSMAYELLAIIGQDKETDNSRESFLLDQATRVRNE